MKKTGELQRPTFILRCPRCGRKFECYTQGVFKSGGALQVYANDSIFCNSCLLDDF